MSELKVFNCQGCLYHDEHFFYSKSETDKVIKELEEKLKNSRNARKYWRKEYLIEYKECCHQKYKRCLAMADGCKDLCAHYQLREVYKKRDFFRKWMFRWLAIAEQFKPNSTAQ